MSVFTARVGPAVVPIDAFGPWRTLLNAHLDEFAITGLSSDKKSFALSETSGRCPTIGERLSVPSAEVEVRWVHSSPIEIFAANRMTSRAALRRVKRFSDPEQWRRSRWLLFLRNAFEMPLLASLEYDHGFIPIHASTVVGPNGAVLILGVNGAGKSTLASKFHQELGFRLAADNFSPCDGTTVLGFPGEPKPKPGATLLLQRPCPGEFEVRGVITVGFNTGGSVADRSSGLAQYMSEDQESHRGTAWDRVFGGDDRRSKANDQFVASQLAKIPTTSYDWKTDEYERVANFVGECCAK